MYAIPFPDLASKEIPQNPDLADEQLMGMIQQQNPNGLGLLHNRYARLMKGIIMKVLHNDAAADDLLQEVFIEIWKRAGSYSKDKGKPLGWMITMCHRRAIDTLRRCNSYRRVCENMEIEAANSYRDCFLEIDENVAKGEMKLFLKRALAALPDAQRITIEFAYFKGMSQREIAATTGIPLGTIKTRMELGLKKLSKSLCGLEELI